MKIFLLAIIAIAVGCSSPIVQQIDEPKPTVTETSSLTVSPTVEPTLTMVPTTLVLQSPIASSNQLSRNREYISILGLEGRNLIEHLAWEPDGKSLTYAVQGEWGTNDVPYVEPKDWNWQKFDVTTGQSFHLSPPESTLSLEIKRALDICASEPMEGDECGRVPILWESPYSDHVIYNPISRGENTWLAHKDGTGAMELESVFLTNNVQWSPDGRWAVISDYAYRAPGMEVHLLLDLTNTAVYALDALTGHDSEFVSYLRPKFSPDGRYMAYAATADPDIELESAYGLFIMDMATLKSEPLTDRFGPFQWSADSHGLYVFDNAVRIEYLSRIEDTIAMRKAALYYIDISDKPFEERLLFDDIDFYPHQSSSIWYWAYSPEAQAISMVGLSPELELGILFLFR